MKSIFSNLTVLAIAIAGVAPLVRAQDPLPSWNEGAPKKAITSFVGKVTTMGSPDFVPVATFDNDGSLVALRFNEWKMVFAEQRSVGRDVRQGTFKKFPPSQKAGSFSLDSVLEALTTHSQ